MKFYDNNKKEITKQEFVSEIENTIKVLKEIKDCLKNNLVEEEVVIEIAENELSIDYLEHSINNWIGLNVPKTQIEKLELEKKWQKIMSETFQKIKNESKKDFKWQMEFDWISYDNDNLILEFKIIDWDLYFDYKQIGITNEWSNLKQIVIYDEFDEKDAYNWIQSLLKEYYNTPGAMQGLQGVMERREKLKK